MKQKLKNGTMLGTVVTMLGLMVGRTALATITVANLDYGPAGQTVYTGQGAIVTADAHYWNNGALGDSNYYTNSLVASDGVTATPWKVAVETYSNLAHSSVAQNTLLGDFTYSYLVNRSTSGRLTISGLIPSHEYQIALYNSLYGQAERFILGSASDWTGGITNTLSSRSSLTVPSDVTIPVYTLNTDYALFTLNADAGGNIYGMFLGPTSTDGGHFAGLQIVEEIPEPATVMLFGLGAALAWWRRRQQ